MKKIGFAIFIVILITSLYKFNLFSFYAAEIDLKDIDVKVIYHYEDDEDEFVGLHNRSKVYFQEGNFSFNPFYEQTLQIIADQDQGIFYSIAFENESITSSISPELFEVCIYEKDFSYMKKKDSGFFQDTIYFELDADLEVSTKWPMLRHNPDLVRSFRMTGEFTTSGIYNDRFIDFQIKRLILFKLKYTTKEYLLSYHGYHGWSRFHMKMLNRYFSYYLRFTGLVSLYKN